MGLLRRKPWLGCSLLILLTGLAIWLGRDLPRWFVERQLAEQLDGRVRLAQLEIHSLEHFDLHGLVIEQPGALPPLERAEVDHLTVRGRLKDISSGRFAELRLSGLRAELVGRSLAAEESGPPLLVDRLIIEPAELKLISPSQQVTRAEASAELTDFGSATRGTLQLTAARLDPSVLISIVAADLPVEEGEMTGLELRLDLQPEGGQIENRIKARAEQTSLAVSGFGLSVEALALDSGLPTGLPAGSPASDVPFQLAVDHLRVDPETCCALQIADLEAAGRWLKDGAANTLDVTMTAPVWESFKWQLQQRDGAEVEGAGQVRGLRLAEVIEPRAPLAAIDGQADFNLRLVAGQPLLSMDALLKRIALDQGPALEFPSAARWQVDLSQDATGRLPLRVSGQLAGMTVTPPLPLPELTSIVLDGALSVAALSAPGTFGGRYDGEVDLLTTQLGRWQAAGQFTQEGDSQLRWRWQGASVAELKPFLARLGFEVPAGLAGNLSAAGTLAGPWQKPRIKARARAEELAWQPGQAPYEVAGSLTTELTLDLAKGALRLTPATFGGELRHDSLGVFDVELQTSLRTDTALKRLAAQDLSVVVADNGADTVAEVMSLSGSATWAADGSATAQLALAPIELESWRQRFGPILPELPDDLTLAGQLGAELAIERAATGALAVQGPLNLKGFGFVAAEGGRVMEGLSGSWRLEATSRDLLAGAGSLTLNGGGDGFLVLWDTLFADFSEAAPQVDVQLQWQAPKAAGRRGFSTGLTTSILAGPRIVASATGTTTETGMPEPQFDWTLDLDWPDLAGSFQRYLQPALSDEADLRSMAGGVSAALQGSRRPDGGSARGQVEVRDLAITSTATELVDLDLDLPIDFDWRGDELVGTRRPGFLSYKRFQVRDLTLPTVHSELWVEGDAIGLTEGVELSVLTGQVAMERLTLRRLLRPDRHLLTEIRLEGLSLQRLSEDLGFLPLEGSIDGYLPRVRLTRDELEVEGGGTVELFGGRVVVHGISGRDVLTRYPRIIASADFENIDLGRLTRRFDFGEMTGIFGGEVRQLELFRGVPVSFEARFQTADTRGARGTVDVKAVKNMTILGTGQGSNIFDRGIQRFFKTYRYSRLGITLSLRDDVLVLRGLESRGERELFLKGRFPFGIDVVNVQPGQTVSFQTMVRRLKNVDF